MIMANSYYTEEQKKALLEGRKAQEPKQKQIRQITAKLDKDAMGQLRDINDNTLETALNTLDMKEGLQSFEDRFKEKFAGFKEQAEQDLGPAATELPDFIGPVRPNNLTDNSSQSVDNTVNVEQQNPMADFYTKHKDAIEAALAVALSLAAKRPVDVPLPDVQPENEPVVDHDRKEVREQEKERKTFFKDVLGTLGIIKNTTSGLLSRFIGYSLEAMAKFAKWTLIIGSLVFAFDVLKTVISKWFQDILKEGEASKELFGSYFGQVKKITESIEKGLDNFDMNNLGKSLKDLFIEPMKLLGDTISTAISEGIGSLIYSMGEYTKSDTLMNAGRGMKISALRDKQKAGLELSGDDVIMLKQQDLADQKDREKKTEADSAAAAAATALSGNMDTGYKPMYEAGGFNEGKKLSQAKLDAANRAAEEEKRRREQMESDLKRLQEDPAYRNAERDRLNKMNKERVEEANKSAEVQKTAPVQGAELDVANEIVDKDSVTDKDRKTIESILQSLEEKNNANKLSEDEKEKFGDILQKWQDKISAVPDSSAVIDKPTSSQTASQTAQANNTANVNNKTVNNLVQRSIQRTDHKPLIALS